MPKKFPIGLLISISMLLSSCFKEDERTIIEEKGISLSIPFPYSIYNYYSYIDLDSVKIVKTSILTSWDLAFESSEKGWHILVNATKSKEIFASGSTDFTFDFSNVNATQWRFDASSGDPDSTAIGNWITENQGGYEYSKEVYILGRNNGDGTYVKLIKLQFIELSSQKFIFIAADLNSTTGDTITIQKNPDYRYVYYSFDAPHQTLLVEPPKDKWDIVAGTYRTILYTSTGIPTPYPVRGVLSNNPFVEVLKINKPDFLTAGPTDTIGRSFSIKQDAIGYDWKDFSGSSGGVNPYHIVPNIYYFVKTKSGNLIKFEFTGYASAKNGENGYPTLRLIILK